ncbi:MAG: hypothetical protein LBK12_01325 [Odoribacteraceae bacterium]|jgi:hypothetical protein|nr:hypothetical protein [Odoribacteraceae bacterium]
MDAGDYSRRFLVILLLAVVAGAGLYYLPETICGVKIKRVDLLSDIRVAPPAVSLDSLWKQLEREDTIPAIDLAARDSLLRAAAIDSTAAALRDSLYRVVNAFAGADSSGLRVEDYSVGHTGLQRFFRALDESQYSRRPARIAFMGDSFIEGDIVVADFREFLQERFGGGGVGFVPITSTAAQFRPTIRQEAEGWVTRALPGEKELPHILSGMIFEAGADEVRVSFKTTRFRPSLARVTSLKLLYERNDSTLLRLTYDKPDTLALTLPPSSLPRQFVLDDTLSEGELLFTRARGFRAYGIALEVEGGVVVDNYALRGNSGLVFERLDSSVCAAFNEIRPYDLIILQYGLNVVSEETLQYGWYRVRVVHLVRHLRKCFPGSDILMLGVSDRASRQNGSFQTMPAVLALLHAQRQAARQAGVPFWNLFGAMGGRNSMLKFVEQDWASKDFSHLNFKGGRIVAKALMNALMLEKEFYDQIKDTDK